MYADDTVLFCARPNSKVIEDNLNQISFDETISLAPHIQYILSKAGKRLGMLSWLPRD